MGRPKHYSTKDIKDVIDDYVSFTGGTVLLNASKIAEHAVKILGLKNFRYYVINRNSETKKYVEDLNKEISKDKGKKLTSAVTAFTQIDIKAYQSMNKTELGQALKNRNTLIEDMADSNTNLLQENLALKDSVRAKDIDIKRLNDLVDETAQNSAKVMEESKITINEQRETINKLIQSVKKSDEAIRLLWEKEAEDLMKHTGIFENDGVVTNPKRTITDIEESIISIAKDAKKLDSGKESEKISNKFMDRLRKI